jgi:N-acetylglucosamine malate deacetylase 1
MIEVESLLVIAPHPDDEILGCGGTIALAAERGAQVNVLVVFDGAAGDPDRLFDLGEYPSKRRREARAGGKHIGVSEYTFWNLPEGHLALEHEIDQGAKLLQELVHTIRPQLVLAPWAGDEHPDHHTVSRAVQRMLELPDTHLDSFDAWGFEVWSPLDPDHLVDVSTVWESKLDALKEHATQLAYGGMIEKLTDLATRHNAGHFEAFMKIRSER